MLTSVLVKLLEREVVKKMNLSHLSFALALYFAAVAGKAIQTEVTDYVHYAEARLWLKLHRTPATWRDARLKCFEEDAMLAAPENEALLGVMNDMISAHGISHVFTGIYNMLQTGVFVSLEGTPLKDMPVSWAPTKPKSRTTESCLAMHDNGMLADNKCTDKLPFICYKKDTVATLSCGAKDNGYIMDQTTGSCYKFHKEDKYWRDAYVTCNQENAHLAIINSDDEAKVLKNLFVSEVELRTRDEAKIRDVVHIGFVNWGTENGLWMTIHGQTLKAAGYDKWNNGEPNNKTHQMCGGMYDNGKLDDVNCVDGDPDKATRYFICEKKPEYTYSRDVPSNNDVVDNAQ